MIQNPFSSSLMTQSQLMPTSISRSQATAVNVINQWKSDPRHQRRPAIKPLPTPPSSIPQARPARPSTSPIDPADPIRDDYQQDMLYFFESEGYWGLVRTIYLRAEQEVQQGTDASQWQILTEDWNSKKFDLYYLLITLPPNIIRSLIRGTLTLDMERDRALDVFVSIHMASISRAGIYINILARGGNPLQLPGGGTKHDIGMFLNGNEMTQMTDFLDQYLTINPTSNAAALAFDAHFPTGDSKVLKLILTPQLRRYATNDRAKNKLNRWRDIAKQQYLDRLPTAQGNTYFKRCLTEVGYSLDVTRRLASHKKNTDTTYIYAFLHAWTTHCMSQAQRFPPVRQYTVFPLWQRSLNQAKVGEFGATVLTSSLIDNGGLNPKTPGNIIFTDSVPRETAPVWRQTAETLFSRKHVAGVLAEERRKMESRIELFKELPHFKDLKQINSTLTQELADVQAKVARRHKELSNLSSRKDQLKREIDDHHTQQTGKALKALQSQRWPTESSQKSLILSTDFAQLNELIHTARNTRNGRVQAIEDFRNGDSEAGHRIYNPEKSLSHRLTTARLEHQSDTAFATWKSMFNDRIDKLETQRIKHEEGFQDFLDRLRID
ncbi:hypothetical protein MMC13_007807 [Lambiella insularis]|nr:hypothetical protein [Lambiella insularis]